MIGAGGIGFAIANNIQSYQFGAAGLAIVLVFVFAYCVELVFTTIKKNYI
jgi:phosphonate transport system permease protein